MQGRPRSRAQGALTAIVPATIRSGTVWVYADLGMLNAAIAVSLSPTNYQRSTVNLAIDAGSALT